MPELPDGGPPTLERYIFLGDPIIVANEMRGSQAAALALFELAEADALTPAPPEVRRSTAAPRADTELDLSVIDELIAIEDGEIVFDEPRVQMPMPDLVVMDRLREPYVDFRVIAAL